MFFVCADWIAGQKAQLKMDRSIVVWCHGCRWTPPVLPMGHSCLRMYGSSAMQSRPIAFTSCDFVQHLATGLSQPCDHMSLRMIAATKLRQPTATGHCSHGLFTMMRPQVAANDNISLIRVSLQRWLVRSASCGSYTGRGLAAMHSGAQAGGSSSFAALLGVCAHRYSCHMGTHSGMQARVGALANMLFG